MVNVNDFSKDECVKYLTEIGVSHTGTLDELKTRIILFDRTPNLVNKLRAKAQRLYTFKCSLDPIKIPAPSTKWTSSESMYPHVNADMIHMYATQKREGSIGQQQKAWQFVSSRKIESIKSFVDGPRLFVKAMIQKSFGSITRPAVVLFHNGVPIQGHCKCAVGLCGTCAHIIATLLFLKHFSDKGENVLKLTCTEQLQTWHRRIKKGSVPMVPLRQLGVKSARASKRQMAETMSMEPADTSQSSFKRDVSSMLKDINNDINKMKINFEHHVYNVLNNSPIGETIHQHLNYRYTIKAAEALGDHTYCNGLLNKMDSIIETNRAKSVRIHSVIDRALHEGQVEPNTPTLSQIKPI